MSTTQIAQTIAEQIGRGALFMLGAKDLVATEDGLQFRIWGRNFRRITKIRITLLPSDTYRVETFRGSGLKLRLADTRDDVYVDDLHATIEEFTGMVTTVPRFSGVVRTLDLTAPKAAPAPAPAPKAAANGWQPFVSAKAR